MKKKMTKDLGVDLENKKAPSEMAFLRIDVGSMNKPLQPVTKYYNAERLLKLVHPMHRKYHSEILFREGVITKELRDYYSGNPW